MPYDVRICEGPRLRFRYLGFTDRKNAHTHLFKHVIRLCDQRPEDAKAVQDPERWEEIIEDPPLDRPLTRRRNRAAERLSGIPGCPLGGNPRVTGTWCDRCHDRSAIREVDRIFSDLSGAYEQAGSRAFDWAFANPSRKEPRLRAFRCDDGSIRIKILDERYMKVVAVIDDSTGDTRLISCFRSVRANRRFRSRLAMETEWASWDRMKLRLDIEAFMVKDDVET